jgi:hypothetical protein
MNKEKPSVHIRLTSEINDWLEKERIRRGNISKAGLVRVILKTEMDRTNNQLSA